MKRSIAALLCLWLVISVCSAQNAVGCEPGSSVCCPYPAIIAEQPNSVTALLPCGEDAGRGVCVDLQTLECGDEMAFWNNYTRVCKCNGNFDGIDCSLCKPGYGGKGCNELIPYQRKSIFSFNAIEYGNFQAALNILKNLKHVLTVNNQTGSVYDAFVFAHYQAVKGFSSTQDFVYGSTGFVTWHRGWLRKLEQYLHSIGYPETQGIPYWDWSDPATREGVFTSTYFGGNGALPTYEINNGPFKDWITIDSNGLPTGQGIMRNLNNGGPTAPTLPDPTTLDYLLYPNRDFDTPPYNFSSFNSFRNAVLGLEDILAYPIDQIGATVRVHEWVGGTFSDLALSPNDPLFVSHMAYVDFLFDRWIENNDAISYPTSPLIPLGHRANDCLVGILPPIKHSELFVESTEIGWNYPVAELIDDDDDLFKGNGEIIVVQQVKNAGVLPGCCPPIPKFVNIPPDQRVHSVSQKKSLTPWADKFNHPLPQPPPPPPDDAAVLAWSYVLIYLFIGLLLL